MNFFSFLKPADLAIVICTESGELEKYSKLLVSSLRTFGGKFKNTPIFSFQPRAGLQISNETKSFFKRNRVNHVMRRPLNEKYPEYPLANKPFTCAYAENTLKYKYLLFLDSDVIILNEPNFIKHLEGHDIMMRPVDSKNIGVSSSEFDSNHYWTALYAKLGIEKTDKRVISTVDGHEILPYYNSGHILVKRSKSIFSKWKVNFNIIMKEELKPADNIFFVEQSVLAATVVQMNLSLQEFPNTYNYPIHMQNREMPVKNKIMDIDDAISIHYHKLFNSELNNSVKAIFAKSSKGNWILNQIELLNFEIK